MVHLRSTELMHNAPLPTGCRTLDALLDGGLRLGEILLVFGERGSGKTSLALQVSSVAASLGMGSVIIYSEGRFPIRRLSDIAGSDWTNLSERIWVLEVKHFEHQDSIVEGLESELPGGVRLLVFDSITGQYRAGLGEHNENIIVNKMLNRQLAIIKDVSARLGLAVLITSEVKDIPDGSGTAPVASTILTYWSERVLKLERVYGAIRKASALRPEPVREALMMLTSRGFIAASDGNG
ncbi:MAG: ATPase domain-containing protein [Candidatus Verstraetearchaeota archaeon]|nr:ATPase domain-containing protein [Candidatus Verstraetearchaeota archaeon]